MNHPARPIRARCDRRAGPRTGPRRQHGLAVLITLLVVLGIGVGLVTSGVTRSVQIQARGDSRTMAAIADAKQALIGRAVADDDRPGSLPCPDAVTNTIGNVPNDGIADDITGNVCPSYIGRLPWKTLGLPDLRDDAGERLWYALSPKFRDHPSALALNSDTRADDRLVYENSTAAILVPEAVAVIFAPGGPLGAQARDATPAPCAVTGTTIPRNQCVSNYLEATGGANNATATGPYVVAPRSDTFNDRLGVLTTAELMPLVEIRVGRELTSVLIEYRVESSCGCYPWAGNALGMSAPGQNRGRVPSAGAQPENWGDGDVPLLPTWFDTNRWGDVIYYSVGQTSLAGAGAACLNCISPTLIVDGIGGYSALFFTTGAASGAGARTYWTGYLDDAANNDVADDVYATPASTAIDRDRLFLMPGNSPLQCAANSKMLVDNAPCELKKSKGAGKKKKSIKPVCAYAAANLSGCTCAAAANVVVKKPCSKKLKNPKCKAAVATLKACTV